MGQASRAIEKGELAVGMKITTPGEEDDASQTGLGTLVLNRDGIEWQIVREKPSQIQRWQNVTEVRTEDLGRHGRHDLARVWITMRLFDPNSLSKEVGIVIATLRCRTKAAERLAAVATRYLLEQDA
jgi:hypothetical protein